MSEKDNNTQETPSPLKKKEESLSSLAAKLEAKYGLNFEDKEKEQKEKELDRDSVSKEIGYNIKEEISDTTFIDLDTYTKTRSRHIEQKYGLKPMNELVSPKTEEQKKKELEDYLKKHSPMGMMQSYSQKVNKMATKVNQDLTEIKKEDETYPLIYQYLEDFPAFRPEINIGEKWSHQITERVKSETEFRRSRSKGDYIYQSWRKGKVGVDKYLILFGIFGAILMPAYIYFRSQKYKEIYMAERGIQPGEEIDFENGKIDIDDWSNHRRFYEDKEEKKKAMQKLAVQKEIKKLEKELYPNGGFKTPTR